MLRVGKLKQNRFYAEEFHLEKDGDRVVYFSIENMTIEDVRKLMEGRSLSLDSIEQGIQLIQLTKYPATYDNEGRLLGVVAGNC
jgi:hypothetical protein